MEQDDPVERARARRRGERAITLGVIGVCAVLAYWRLTSTFTFMMDDLIQFDLDNRAGFGWQMLSQNVFQHFGPLNRLGHFVLLRWGDADPRWGALVAALIIATLLLVVAWLAAELGFGLVRRVLLVALVGGSLSVLDSAVWADALFHVLLALIATYAIVACHLRANRSGDGRWHWASVALFGAGLLVQERSAFALPLIVLVDLLLVWRLNPWRVRWGRLWALRRPLLTMAGIAAVAAVWLATSYASGGDGRLSPSSGLQTWLLALTNFQFPQLAGYQPDGGLTIAAQLAVLVVIVLGACGVAAIDRRRNTGPVLFFFAVFTLYWSFLALSPLLDADTIAWNAGRLHNAAYVTVPAYVAILSLSGPASWGRRWRSVPTTTRRRVGAAGVVTVLALLVVAGGVHVERTWDRYRSAHAFWTGVRDAEPIWTDPSVTVVPLQVPPSVATEWAVQQGQEINFLPILAPAWSPGPVADRTIALTPEGRPVDVVLDRVATAGPAGGGATPTCLTATSPRDWFAFVAQGSAPAGAPVLAHVRYTTSQDGQLSAIPLSDGESRPSSGPVPLRRPAGDVLVPLPIDKPDSMIFTDLAAESTTCILGIDLVRPLAVDGSGLCRQLDPYGAVGAVTRCPDAG